MTMRPIKFAMANGHEVKVTREEIDQFITLAMTNQPYWRYSLVVSEAEVRSYLDGKADRDVLRRVAQYILFFAENTALSAYLFAATEGYQEASKKYNLPPIQKLRALNKKAAEVNTLLLDMNNIVHEMFGVCMKVGIDPL